MYDKYHHPRTICIGCQREKTGIILSLPRYKMLMEDLHDLVVIAERQEEEPVSIEEMKRRLKDDGIL